MDKTRKLILTALFAALTCAATYAVRIPTPTFGYIHPGDALVLLAGVLLGPAYGGFAAGLGSALSDLFAGYFIYVPATAIIKALVAITASILTKAFSTLFTHSHGNGRNSSQGRFPVLALLLGGIVGEVIMVAGYFIFEIFILGFSGGSMSASASISAGIVASAAGIPFNAVQGIFGVIIASILYPILQKILDEAHTPS